MGIPLDPRQSVHIARQPILDIDRQVRGYELLYRAQASDRSCTTAGDLAASRVVTDAMLSIGLETLTGGTRAFINFTRQLLLENAAQLLPAESVVVELREDIEVDDAVIEACRDLQARGYTLALDDYAEGSRTQELLPYVRYVKLDVLATPAAVWQPLARKLSSPTLEVIAERVETADVVTQARSASCSLFQGYYFCRPVTHSAKALAPQRMAYMNLFAAINRPDLTIAKLEELVKGDVALTFRVLRSINSGAFAIGQTITSVRHALVLLGVQQVRKWASVWAMAGVNSGGTPETISVALLRARTCEIVGNAWSGPDAGGEMFLLGMCSLLDGILNQPMDRAIVGLQLTRGVRDALLGGSNALRSILDAVIAHEQGDWDRSTRLIQALGLPPGIVPSAYADALQWARDLTSTAAAA